jgi:hypothetical protein
MVGSQPRHPVAAPHPKLLQAVGQAPDPLGELRIGERAVVARQRHLVGGDPGATLNPRADPEVGPSRWHRSHGQGYPHPAPRRQEPTRHADPGTGQRFASPRIAGLRRRELERMQGSVLIQMSGRPPRSGHEADHLTARSSRPWRRRSCCGGGCAALRCVGVEEPCQGCCEVSVQHSHPRAGASKSR